MPHTLTLDQVAQALQCSRSTVKREVRRHNLRVVKVGRLTRVTVAELARYEERQRA